MLLDRLSDERWQINVSNALLSEYEDVLKRKEMNSFVSPLEVDKFINAVCSVSTFHEIFFLWRSSSRDSNDSFLIELAAKSQADFIITFNTKDLSAAVEFGVKLVTPREFLEFVGDLP